MARPLLTSKRALANQPLMPAFCRLVSRKVLLADERRFGTAVAFGDVGDPIGSQQRSRTFVARLQSVAAAERPSFREFSRLFDFRLLQHYWDETDLPGGQATATLEVLRTCRAK